MVPPGQVPDGAQVVAVVALVPGHVGPVGSAGTGGPVQGRRPPAPAPAPGEAGRTLEPAPARPIGPGLLLDLDGRRVLAAGCPLDLTRREFDLLAHLATRPGRVLTRAQLLATVWSPADAAEAADTGPRTVDVHVARLRRKLAAHGAPLSTLRGVGYRWSERAEGYPSVVSRPKVRRLPATGRMTGAQA
jgi:DNA-binding winged helix-turn-helix (wHTH) protein